jgi:PilZ domain
MPSSQEERPWNTPRAFRRFLLDIRVVIKAKETLHGRTKDLGEGGLGATIPGNIDLGEIVELEFQLPETNEPLRLKAEVRYRHGFQYGFRFLHPLDQQRELICRATTGLPVAP